jgi:hypothetical protein
MSAATQLSTDFLQEFQYAGEQSGVSLDKIALAAQTLQKNLAGGNDSVNAALKRIGLELDDLRGMSPEQAFEAVGVALRDVGDQARFVADGAALMGKGFNEIAPLIRSNFEELTQKARDLGIVIDSQTVAALGELDDNLNTLTFVGRAVLADLLEPMMPLLNALAGAMSGFGHAVSAAQDGFQSMLATGAGWMQTFYDTKAAILDSTNAFGLLDNQIQTARENSQWWADTQKGLQHTQQELTQSTRDAEKAARDKAAADRAAAAAAQDLLDVENRIKEDIAGAEGLSGAMKESIKWFLDHGAAQADLVKYFGVTSAAVRALSDELQKEKQALAEATEAATKKQIALDNLSAVFKGPEAIDENIRQLAIEAINLGAAQSDVAAAFDLSATAMKQVTKDAKDAKDATKNLTDAIASLTLANAQARRDNQAAEGFDVFGNRLPTTADEQAWQSYYDKIEELRAKVAAAGAKGAIVDVSELEAKYWRELQDALNGAAAATDGVVAGLQRAGGELKKVGDEIDHTANKAKSAKETFGQFAGVEYPKAILTEGGVVRDLFGRPVTPGIGIGNLPKVERPGTGGFYTSPWGNVGGTYFTMNMNGAVLGTQEQLAKLIQDSLMSSYRAGGNRVPV